MTREEIFIIIKEEKAKKYIISLTVSEQFKTEGVPLLEYIKKQAGIGHSFPVVVDPDDSEYRKEFGIDGDGTSHIYDIKVGEKKRDHSLNL